MSINDKITNALNFYHKSEAITESLITVLEETVIACTNELAKEELDEHDRQELATNKLEIEEILSDLRASYEDQLDAEESMKDYDKMEELVNKYL